MRQTTPTTNVYINIKIFSTRLFDLLPFGSESFGVSYIPNCFKLLFVQCVVGGTGGDNDGGGLGGNSG